MRVHLTVLLPVIVVEPTLLHFLFRCPYSLFAEDSMTCRLCKAEGGVGCIAPLFILSAQKSEGIRELWHQWVEESNARSLPLTPLVDSCHRLHYACLFLLGILFCGIVKNEISMQFLSLFVVASLGRREDWNEILSCVKRWLFKRLLKEMVVCNALWWWCICDAVTEIHNTLRNRLQCL